MASSLFLWTAAGATAWAPWLMNWSAAQVNDVAPAVERAAASGVTAADRDELRIVDVILDARPPRARRQIALPAQVVQINQHDVPAGEGDVRTIFIKTDVSGSGEAAQQTEQAKSAAQQDDIEVVEATRAAPGWRLGVSTEVCSEALRSQLKLQDRGLSIVEVYPDTAAAEAGLKKHDVLTSVGGAPVSAVEDLVKAIATSEGKKIQIELLRDGAPLTIEVAPKKPTDEAQEQYTAIVNRLSNDLGAPHQATVGPNGEVVLRVYGLGAVVPAAVVKLPDHVKVTISKQGDKPAEVVVKRGDDEFKGTEGDLSKIPDDLKDVVEYMLSGVRVAPARGVKADSLMLRNRYPGVPPAAAVPPGMRGSRLPTPAEHLQAWLLQQGAAGAPPRAVVPAVPSVPAVPPVAGRTNAAEGIEQRLDAIQKTLEKRLDAIEKSLEKRLDAIEKQSRSAS